MFATKTFTTAVATVIASAAFAAAGAPAASAASTTYSHTPSGNITCKTSQSRAGWSLACSVRDARRTLRISADGTSYESRYQRIPVRGQELEYDEAYGLGPFSCMATYEGLACMHDDTEEAIFLSSEDSFVL